MSTQIVSGGKYNTSENKVSIYTAINSDKAATTSPAALTLSFVLMVNLWVHAIIWTLSLASISYFISETNFKAQSIYRKNYRTSTRRPVQLEDYNLITGVCISQTILILFTLNTYNIYLLSRPTLA